MNILIGNFHIAGKLTELIDTQFKIILKYPFAEDKEITITLESIKPEIIVDSPISISGIAGKELTPIEYIPEIGPTEYYTDKTKFTYSMNSYLPPGIYARTENGKLIIGGNYYATTDYIRNNHSYYFLSRR